MAHVLVVPFPSQGHMNPLVQFAKALASKGVDTTLVITRFIARTACVDARPAMVETISDGHDEGGVASAASLGEYIEKQKAAGSASLAALIEARAAAGSGSSGRPGPFTCVVYDSFEQWVLSVARQMGLPAVPFSTQSCLVSAVYYYVSQGRLVVQPPTSGDGAVTRSEALEGLPEMERSEFPSFVFDDGPYPMIAELALKQFAEEGKDDLVLFNSFEELESEVLAGLTNHMKARAIGPCVPLPVDDADFVGRITYGANLLNPEDACIKWLDTKARGSVAYVSFGSFASLGAAQTEEIARGLLAAGKPFLWVVRATEEAQLPRDILDDATASGAALIVRWSPQLDVLAHQAVGCFLTHCGWNSSLEALSFGVPMVAMGLWTDQPTNSLNVERAWGAGVRAHRDADAGMFLRGEVERCVRTVMDEGDGASAARKAAGKWREKARAAVAPGGSSDRNMDEFVEFVRAGTAEKWKALVLEGSEPAGPEM
ncbi:indole-3-acetate beta-glucosyltransferase-like [Phragmites australis]|uniref:indole-3-acetate beta-glucosyltransferase-like n=1 Tax=Phragmites australis TaxID=29695 RepID=UPI002D78D501|nr:indole-3-acetate beta-glucosyltransferase-like [Phragmites australis]